MFKKIIFGLLPFMMACSSMQTRHAMDENQSGQSTLEKSHLEMAEQMLALGRAEDARNEFHSFQTKFPQSTYLQSARLGEAQALENLGNLSEAIAIDRDVYLKTQKQQPEIAALAMYRMSFAYEALGDDMKTIAALLDAQSLGSSLPVEVSKAEIPARLASAYGRVGRDREAIKYLNEAEKGISEIRETRGNLNQKWLAKTYVQMGSVSTNQLSLDNFDSAIEGQRLVQVYLIKAMQINDSTWSERALDQAKSTYQNFYSVMDMPKLDRELQGEMGGSLIDLITQAELFKPLAGQTANETEKDFFSYLKELRKKTEDILYQSKETMSLTEESQKLHSIKRPGKIEEPSQQ
ncbi:MAG TPA: tetratricopeptide repeat protein, partial [Bdellovibrio sp.]|nr:tetratricopeptide repeat protein [Bdellovibrio sp.]